ncbi:PIN domain-containing protein [Dehalococcoidales bacterium]|nr:PIN domain-containing protein [Dehalococcoidales bacterium]
MKAGEIAFVDTNILAYALDTESLFHLKAIDLVNRAGRGEIRICISPQVAGELYATITNPRKVSHHLSPDEAVEIVRSIWEAENIQKLYPKESTLKLTLDLVKRYQLRALDFFDAQIVATMLENGLTTLYTVNEDDFAIFEEIKAVNPFEVD